MHSTTDSVRNMAMANQRELLRATDPFIPRHLGPSEADIQRMLMVIGATSLDDLVQNTVPAPIRLKQPLRLDSPRGEFETLHELRAIARRNRVFRSLIGMGYHDCITPPVIQRNILENPGWYTQYTPYQAEIAQGRLEALLNYQTMVADLTGLPLANASLLDEATAAAEAMHLCHSVCKDDARRGFFVAADCHPQTIAVVQTRALPLGFEVHVGDPHSADFAKLGLFGVLIQTPTTDGRIYDYADIVQKAHAANALVVVATDLLALTLTKPPGEYGADVAIGSSQRFGVPLGGGGPHAAFMATREQYARQLPGRLIGVSKDAQGKAGFRLAIQTREQHIRREKATSNICTAQVLLAVIAGMYAVYYGPGGLKRIASRVHAYTAMLAAAAQRLGHEVLTPAYFDTLRVRLSGGKGGPANAGKLRELAEARNINFRYFDDGTVGVSLDETIDSGLFRDVCACFANGADPKIDESALLDSLNLRLPEKLERTTGYLTHPVFNSYHAEHEMLRYIRRLESRDLSLTSSMIPLGSCTMKLNATSEMFPVTWSEFGRIHPFAPADQQQGYQELFKQLEGWLAEISGFSAISLQPNAGAQGEYTGLLVIRAYHVARGDTRRDVCLIPVSAHGTNPASAVLAGFRVVAVRCDALGNIDVDDLRAKAAEHRDRLAALMVTYPSTHGVFEEEIREICEIVHRNGGQVYMDGANMNAQVGLCRPADIGADVCHLNLHKTFCIPHGGGGPGMGPIGVQAHLAPFLPGHPVQRPHSAGEKAIGPVSAAPFGSPSILPISWMYIRMMGAEGLRKATQVAILNANYMAKRLENEFAVVFRGKHGRVAHEFILDCRPFEDTSGIRVEDIAKRLMDYGFHAPTMSWPVAGTLMIEPTESESKAELDRLCDSLLLIREEIRAIEQGRASRDDNPLKHAPHTAAVITANEWKHAYSREQAAYPAQWLREHKFWPAVGRIDNVWGDRNLFCTCPPLENVPAELVAAR